MVTRPVNMKPANELQFRVLNFQTHQLKTVIGESLDWQSQRGNDPTPVF